MKQGMGNRPRSKATRRALALMVASAALGGSVTATAGWTYHSSTAGADVLVPDDILEAAGGDYWLEGTLVSRFGPPTGFAVSTPGRALQRFSAEGVAVGTALPSPWPVYSTVRLDPTGVFLSIAPVTTDVGTPGSEARACQRSVLDGGALSMHFQPGPLYAHAGGWLDGFGGSFVSPTDMPGRLLRYAPDCSLHAVGDYDFGFDQLLNDPTQAGAFAVTSGAAAPSEPRSRLRAFSSSGERWERELLVGDSAAEALFLLGVDAGDAIVAGQHGADTVVFRVGSDGSIRWTQTLAGAQGAQDAVVSSTTLSLALVTDAGEAGDARQWVQIDPDDGAVLLRTESFSASSVRPVPRFAPTEDSVALLEATAADASRQLLRVAANGAVEAVADIGGYRSVLARADGSLLLAREGLLDTELRSASLDLDGEAGIEPSDGVAIGAPAWWHDALTGEASAVVYWQQGRPVLETIGSDGTRDSLQVLTESTFAGDPRQAVSMRLVPDPQGLCIVFRRDPLDGVILDPPTPQVRREQSILCLDSGSGEPRFERTDLATATDPAESREVTVLQAFPPPEGVEASLLVASRARTCPAETTCPRLLERLDTDADGTLTRSLLTETRATAPGSVYLAPYDAGAFLLQRTDETAQVHIERMDAQGETSTLLTLPESWSETFLEGARALRDGSIVIWGPESGGTSTRLALVGAGGGLIWETVLEGSSYHPAQFWWLADTLEGDASAVTLVLANEDTARLVQLDATGSILADLPLDLEFGNERPLSLNPIGTEVRLASRRGEQALMRRIDLASGHLRGFERASAEGRLLAASWTPEGSLVLASQGSNESPTASRGSALSRVDFAPLRESVPSLADLDLLGAWYDPSTTGQGIFLQQVPGTDSVAGAWFSFDQDGGTRRAALRWYTLQAGADPSADAVTLVIRAAEGGGFDVGPAITPVDVGEATLRSVDCDRIALDYRFDRAEEGFASGTLLLQRLTPGGAGCRDEATIQVVDSNSGFWYDPQTSGQGLSLQAFSPQPGLVAGAWYTFDPEGEADDPGAQHWFTFVGQADAQGDIAIELFRTLGGRFDLTPTRNTSRVGSGTLRFEACGQATMGYAFEDDGVPGGFAGLTGELTLQRIGACP